MLDARKTLLLKLKASVKMMDRWSGGRFKILLRAAESFTKRRATQAAAGIAYYALFSLFPLLLLSVAAGGYFLTDQIAYQQALRLITNALPVSKDLIRENLQQVITARGAVSIVGAVGLLWSASSVFSILADTVSRAWTEVPRRSFLKDRLIGLGMIGVLALLLIASIFIEAAAGILASLQSPSTGILTPIWHPLSNLISGFFIFVLLLALYLWVPARPVNWQSAFWSAFGMAILWKIATNTFVWYLSSGLGHYQLIYGSLGAVVALIFLIYIVSAIVLFGAHLTAAIEEWRKNRNRFQEHHLD